MYRGQRIGYEGAPPRQREQRHRRRRHSPLFYLTVGLALGFCLGWALRGLLSAWDTDPEGPRAPKQRPGTEQGASSRQTALKAPPSCPDWIEQDFLTVNPCSRPGTKLETVDGIVVHYVGNPGTTARQNHSYFQNLARTGETYASSHFLIGLEGEILQNVPLDEVAYCSSQRNGDTISIECCHPEEDGAFTPETYRSLVKLVKWLMDYYGLEAEQVIRHYDVTGKECPLYYVRDPGAWEIFLADLEQ